jgi:hypothetical protein
MQKASESYREGVKSHDDLELSMANSNSWEKLITMGYKTETQ